MSGRVQGVGFRFTTLRLAQEMRDIYGHVENLDDGRVYIEVMGEERRVEYFIENLNNYASFMARIDQIEIIEDDSIEMKDSFKVR